MLKTLTNTHTHTHTHTYERILKTLNATFTWIMNKLRKRLKEDLDMKLIGIRKELSGSYGIKSSKMQLYKVKWKIKD